MNEFGCGTALFAVVAFVLSLVALSRTRAGGPSHSMRELEDAIARTAREIDRLWKQLRSLEAELKTLRSQSAAVPGPSSPVTEAPRPTAEGQTASTVVTIPAPLQDLEHLHFLEPEALPAPPAPIPLVKELPPLLPAEADTLPLITEPLPGAVEILATASVLAQAAEPTAEVVPAAPTTLAEAIIPVEPAAAPASEAAEPPPPLSPVAPPRPVIHAAAPRAVPPPSFERTPVPDLDPPAAAPARVQSPIPPHRELAPTPAFTAPPKPRRNLEDLLGTQLFLKAGVAILVIGVVFAMGLVFQRMGPLGRILMGYALGGGMLAGGMYAERFERYRTFGRAIVAGAWGILYFVTYAAGFLEPSRVFSSQSAAILALLVAAAAAVGFSLRYRHEWTTTSAFLLIFVGLAMAAWELQPAFNLAATAIVAMAMAVLVWRTGWVRLLGFGLPATWATITFWILKRAPAKEDPALMGTLLLCWAAFQLALIFWDGEEEREAWVGLSQIGNFLGGLGLCLQQTLHHGHPWMWAAGFGLASLAIAWAYRRRGHRRMYLLAASEGVAALALVTPLRLGWKNHLVPVYRLLGIELLLLGGVLLRERYFRLIAYGAFTVTLLEILLLKLDPSQGIGRSLLLGTAAVVWLLNAGLLHARGQDACPEAAPEGAWAFSGAGTLMAMLLIRFDASTKLQGPWYAALAVLWVGLGLWRGLRDLLAESVVLGGTGFVCTLWLLHVVSEGPGQAPSRLWSAAGTAVLLALASEGTRRYRGREVPESWRKPMTRFFSFAALAILSGILYRELPPGWTAFAYASLAAVLAFLAVFARQPDLSLGALAYFGAALAFLVLRPPSSQTTWLHLTARGWSLAGVLGMALAMESAARSRRGIEALLDWQRRAVRWLPHLAAFGLLYVLVLTEVPLAWRAIALAAVGCVHLAAGMALAHADRANESLFFLALAWVHLALDPPRADAGWWHITTRGWTLIGVAALSFLFEATSRLRHADRAFREPLRRFACLFSCTGALAIAALVLYLELPASWVAVAFGAAALLCMGLGMLWRQRERVYGAMALLATALVVLRIKPAAYQTAWAHLTTHGWSLAGTAAAAYGLEFLARRGRTGDVLPDTDAPVAKQFPAMSGLCLVVWLVWTEAPHAWIAVLLAALAALHLALGMLWSHISRAYASIALLVLSLYVLWLFPASSTTVVWHVSLRGWTMLGVGAIAFALEAMTRLQKIEAVFGDRERIVIRWVFGLAGLGLLWTTIWTEAPDPLVAPLLSALSAILLLLGLLLGFKEQVVGSALATLASLAALLALGLHAQGTWLHVAARAWNLGALSALALGQELVVEFWRKAWIWPERGRDWLRSGHSLVAVFLLIVLGFLDIDPKWGPAALMLAGTAWMAWARRRPSLVHGDEALALGAAAFVLMATPGWFLTGSFHGIPERTLSLGLGLLVAYALQRETFEAGRAPDSPTDRLRDLVPGLPLAATAILGLTSFGLAMLVREECWSQGQEALIPLLLGLLALVYLERGRSLPHASWTWLAHLGLVVAAAHIATVNMDLDRTLHGISLRTWTVTSFLALLAAVHAGWRRHHEGTAPILLPWRPLYLYGSQLLLAWLVAYELQRPWVALAWMTQACASLWWGAHRRDNQWLRAALGLAVVASLRSLLINLPEWSDYQVTRPNWVVLPVSCALLLSGYIRLKRLQDDSASRLAYEDLWDGRHRMPWFSMMATLAFGFIWIEVSGTALTVWLTGYGFLLVGLGFLFRERIGRLLGLGLLSSCVLKLFLWDLRGLTGLPRVASFIVLGLVLISVSFVYTRFKERIEALW